MGKRFLVTGGAGFIGSAVCRHLIRETSHDVLVVDKLTYAGNLESLAPVRSDPRFRFLKADIVDAAAMRGAFESFRPDVVMHLAAESHVDRSIDGPAEFLHTNVIGTFVLLQAARDYWKGTASKPGASFRFHHISTDEVFGSLGAGGRFTENSAYRPNSPYAASKAASDHFVRVWGHTYGLPVIVSNCSNNYGPYHFPEKLIPLVILNALEGRRIPVYGQGENIRDWLFVEDHARALVLIAERGEPGADYNIGSNSERSNIALVREICRLLDTCAPDAKIGRRELLIEFVEDRPGHDFRYAIDASRIQTELGWLPRETLESGLEKTVRWYIANENWWRPLREKVYSGARLGSAG